MKQEEANIILHKMSVALDNVQMLRLQDSLDEIISESDSLLPLKSSEELLESFLSTKRLEGRSEKTLGLYRFTITKMIESFDKNVCVLTTEEIRNYLSEYQTRNDACKATIDNIRRNLSSFFKWLEDENYIFKSPIRRIHKIKTPIVVRETYSDEDLERLRDGCKYARNLAIIDFLNSTGIRVSELVGLDIDDIDFNERECIVLGKGDKERVAYFDARTKIHLKEYLATRDDDNPALFVSIRHPAKRLTAGGVEIMLKRMGQQCNVDHCHPHRFRRTLATNAINKGMPIEQVQRLLGHEKMDTTLRYALVQQSNVKMSHRKYIG